TVTVAEWRRLLGGVRAAAGVDLTGPPDSDTASWMRLRAESAHVGGAKLMAMCDELPDVTHQSMARRAIVVGLLRSMARNTDGRAPTDVRPLWRLLRPTLDVSSGIPIRATVGSQGFYVIPLFSVVRQGRIEELLRLHVWPGGKTAGAPTAVSAEDHVGGTAPLSVHTHQPPSTSSV